MHTFPVDDEMIADEPTHRKHRQMCDYKIITKAPNLSNGSPGEYHEHIRLIGRELRTNVSHGSNQVELPMSLSNLSQGSPGYNCHQRKSIGTQRTFVVHGSYSLELPMHIEPFQRMSWLQLVSSDFVN